MEDAFTLVDSNVALDPLLDAAKDSLGSLPALRALVVKILSHPDIFSGYDELKEVLVQGGVKDEAILSTLDLFSYGEYGAYVSNQGSFMPLNEKQVSKMRQLTLLSCVKRACEKAESSLTYDSIGEALHLSDQRSMEQVIVATIYNRALNGKLCQKSRRLLLAGVPTCISRDVSMEKIPNMLLELQAFQERLATSHGGLEEAHSEVSKSLAQSDAYWKMVEDKRQKAQDQARKLPAGGPSRGMGNWPEAGAGRRTNANRPSNKRSRGGLGGPYGDPFPRM
mmetsp:Transcript_84765/g.245079  ORF Transcript_84765/g.245079 Transcript_84765/m.245079 type:complete len:280 (-) Transcript_84765:46-885(-)